MYYVGIDVAKDKHDCCIVNDAGDIIMKPFRIKNSLEGFTSLLQRIDSITSNRSEVIIGLEDTGHYPGNLINYFGNLVKVQTINPLLVAKQKKAETLRKTKTDKIDATQIAKMLRNGVGFRPVISIPYDSDELKSLSRYRLTLVKNRSKEKTSVKRLINILFPEHEQFFADTHCTTSYAILSAYPSKDSLSTCHTPSLANILYKASRGRYESDLAIKLRQTAKSSIGKTSDAKSFELQKTLKRIQNLDGEIAEVETKLSDLLAKSHPPITTIPGIGDVLAASIIGEIGDFSRFSNPGKILAMAGMSPTTYQSGKLTGARSRMEKRGSSVLRHSLFLATQSVCCFVPEFRQYLDKKRSEGKHYYVAISHTAKKLVRLMYALETQHRPYDINIDNKEK